MGTLGRSIHDGAQKVKLFGEEVLVRAEIATLPGKSGHADRDGLTAWLQGFVKKPQMVFVNHGENTVCDHFVAHLEQDLGYKAFAPFSGAEFDLASGVFQACPEGIPVAPKKRKADRTSLAFQRLRDVSEALPSVIQQFSGLPNRDVSAFAKDLEKLIRKWENHLK